jgi:hypothetical protein
VTDTGALDRSADLAEVSKDLLAEVRSRLGTNYT